jgi:hypothetical protein
VQLRLHLRCLVEKRLERGPDPQGSAKQAVNVLQKLQSVSRRTKRSTTRKKKKRRSAKRIQSDPLPSKE